jgi:MtrB/PioB family decaheme-associated outer membrane protein
VNAKPEGWFEPWMLTWQFSFEWDQMRHVLFTNTRMLSGEPDRGVFTLSTPRPPLASYNTAPERDISVRWDTARMGFRYSFTPDFDVKAEYTRIRKDGDRPFGLVFGSPGNNFLQVLEPIEQTTHDFRLQGTYATEQWQLVFSYIGSVFVNEERRVRADNPCFGNAGQCTGGDVTGAPPSGQVSLPPSNMAHTFSLSGGMNLPMRTRLNANFTYSLRLQDDTFLPHTINDAIKNDPQLQLPQKSLNGNVQIYTLLLQAVTRPWTPLTLSAKYRLYDQNELSDRPIFEGVVPNDRTVNSDEHRAARLDYTKHNIDLDARYQVIQPLAVTLGTGWERWDRSEGREAGKTDEFFAKAVIDATPADWAQARLTYRPSFRRLDHYNTLARQETIVIEDVAEEITGQSKLLRKFDQADRDRQRVDVDVTFTPTETVTITPTFSYRWDDYVDSRLGLQDETSWSTGIDFNFTPSQWFSFSAGYMYEKNDQHQRQRQRTAALNNIADFDWISHNVDTVQTVHTGARGAIIPSILEWAVGANWSYALGRVDTSNPVPPASGTAAQNFTATAKPMPAFEDQLFRVDVALKYHFAKAWTATLGYAWESFEKNDWRTDSLNPFVPVPSAAGVPGQTSIWLGGDIKNYSAHIIGATLAYRFK